jgi:ornithine--oxo-acid transaminase
LGGIGCLAVGHCHPKLVQTATEQIQTLTLTSRAFYNNKLPVFLEKLSAVFDYQRATIMNTGAEAVETALKLARKWGYSKKQIPDGQAHILICSNNYHGRTITTTGISDNYHYKNGFAPYPAGFSLCNYDDMADIESKITPNTCAILVEPIQGEGGVIIPSDSFLPNLKALCEDKNILLIADEIQVGVGRTGTWLTSFGYGIKPDIVCIAKSISGGIMPVACVLYDDKCAVFEGGQHGSTYGGNPMVSAICTRVLEIFEEEKLLENCQQMGAYFLGELQKIQSAKIKDVRGKGLILGIEFQPEIKAMDIALQLLENKIICATARNNVVRFLPPLITTKEQIDEAVSVIKSVLS